MQENPKASLLFYWPSLGRQLRIEGSVERISAARSDAYFASRSRASQLAAHASKQSAPIQSAEEMAIKLKRVASAYPEPGRVPRPKGWGGWRIKPHRIELWYDGKHRLHERRSFVPTDDGSWAMTLQQP